MRHPPWQTRAADEEDGLYYAERMIDGSTQPEE